MNDDLLIGGVQRLVVEIANRLSRGGYAVTVAARRGGALWSELDEGIGSEYLVNGKGILGKFKNLLQLRSLVVKERYDVIHSHQRGLGVLSLLSCIGTSTKVVEHVHNTFEPGCIGRLSSFRGDHLIACGAAVRVMLVDVFGRTPGRVSLIPNTVRSPDERLVGLAQRKSYEGDRPIVIVGVGRMVAQKDPERFVRIIAGLTKRLSSCGVEIRGKWIGDGPLRYAVSRQIAALEGDVHVELCDETTDVNSYLVESDLIMLTSRWEGLPLVLLEAMALNCGLIAPNVGSCKDVVEDGLNGVLYEVGASDDEIVERVAIDLAAGHFVDWGDVSRSRFLSRGGLEELVADVSKVYSAVVATRLVG